MAGILGGLWHLVEGFYSGLRVSKIARFENVLQTCSIPASGE